MKIYTRGQLLEICVDGWKVAPIVEIPFNWTGYCDRIRFADLDGTVDDIRISPCSLSLLKRGYSSYRIDVKGVIDFIYSSELSLLLTLVFLASLSLSPNAFLSSSVISLFCLKGFLPRR